MTNVQSPSSPLRLRFNFFWAGVARSVIAVAGFAGTALLTRILPPAEVGVYFIALAAATLAGPLANISLREPTVRALAAAMADNDRGTTSGIARRSLMLGTICSLAAAVLLGGSWEIAAHLGWHTAVQYHGAGFFVSLWIAIFGIENQLVGILQGLERIREAVSLDGALGRLIAVTALAALWLSVGRSNIYIVLLVFVSAELASVTVGCRLVLKVIHELGPPLKSPPFMDLWSTTWPFLLHQITANAAAQADLIILGLFSSPQQVAIYGTATRLAGLPTIPVAALNVPIAPSVARLQAQSRMDEVQKLLQRSAAAFTTIALLATATWVAAGRWLLTKFFGGLYGDGIGVLLILGVGQCLNVYFGQCMLALAMTGAQRTLTKIAVVSSLIKVSLLLVCAALFGLLGVAAASTTGNTIALLAGWWTVHRLLGIYTHARWTTSRNAAGPQL